ncbi:MAG: DUF1223 domain-containing protein [Candidatus Acidiferrales bacterium]
MPPAPGATTRTPVLVELFTSEGCSSCPPADKFLADLDRSQPVPAAEIIVLSEHVDYWDDGGWRDPFSSHDFTERQRAYVSILRIPEAYTPQMVVDGRFEFVGSDERTALRAIATASGSEKAPVTLSGIHLVSGHRFAMHLNAGPLPASAGVGQASIILAVADDSDESQVQGGENSGRKLSYVAVLRNLEKVGKVDRTAPFSGDVAIGLKGGSAASNRVVAFIQEGNGGRIWGAASARAEQ